VLAYPHHLAPVRQRLLSAIASSIGNVIKKRAPLRRATLIARETFGFAIRRLLIERLKLRRNVSSAGNLFAHDEHTKKDLQGFMNLT
jgi:hypothetical protein